MAVSVLNGDAAVVQWTNTAGGNWNITNNWSPNVLPTSQDTAVMTNDGSYVVNINVSPTLSSLILGGTSGTQVLAIASGTLTVNSNATVGPQGQFSFSGGVLTVSAGLTLQGTMLWSGGQVSSTTAVIVGTNGVITLSGSAPKLLAGSITNGGRIVSSGSVGFTVISGNATLHNLQTGLFDAQSAPGFSGLRVINDGRLRKSGGLGPTTFTGTEFINNAIIEAQSGTITLQAITLGEGSSYIGAGTNLLASGTMNGSFTSENLVLNSLGGPGLSGIGTLHGSMIWSNGTIAAGAALTVAPDATLTLASSNSRTLNGAMTNGGTIQWTGGSLQSGVIHNLQGALLEAQDTGFGGIAAKLIINDGTIRKSSGSGTSSLSGDPFIHNGILDAQTGTIKIGGSLGGPSTVLGNGSSFVGSGTNSLGGEVILAGSFTSSNLVGGGDSVVSMQGSGILHGTALFPVNLVLPSGARLTIAPDGILTLKTTLLLTGEITNAGTIYLQTTPIIVGGSLHNLESGTVDLRGDFQFGSSGNPPLINDGLFRKSGGAGTNTFPAGLSFINNGTLMVQTGTVAFSGNLINETGTLALAGGRILSTNSLTLPGGRVTGFGTLQAPSITSGALIDPGTTNAVIILSGSYTQLLAGSMEFNLSGTEPGQNQSQIIVTEHAHLSGLVSVRLNEGYSPEIGANHELLHAGSLSGEFKCFNGFHLLGENKHLGVSYSPTNVILAAVAAADPPGPSLSIAKEIQSVICWPTEFTGYDLYFNTNLSDIGWTFVPGATNRHFETPLLQQKFFRLIKQP